MQGSDRTPDPVSEQEKGFALTRISEVIDKAFKGELPRDRQPYHWEPSVLSPAHMNMILDRAAGYNLKEIAARWDYTEVQVANVLGSPDAQTILSTISALQAGTLLSMESRFKALAPEALNVKVSIMRDTATPASVRDRAASDILDRAGYAPRQQSEVEHKHKLVIPSEAAVSLKEVLAESMRVRTKDYSGFLQKISGATDAGGQPEPGQPAVDCSASPVPSLTPSAA